MPESPLGDSAAPRRERPTLPGRSARRFQFMHALHAANLKVSHLCPQPITAQNLSCSCAHWICMPLTKVKCIVKKVNGRPWLEAFVMWRGLGVSPMLKM